MRFEVGDTVEFELAPDGYCSRWNTKGKTDRGATDNWRRGTVKAVEYISYNRKRYVVESNKDTYYFEMAEVVYAWFDSYPSAGIRRITKHKAGTVKLVDKGGHFVTEEL